MNDIFQDWDVNPDNPKGRFVLTFFRLCQVIRAWPGDLWLLGSPVLLLYVFFVEWILGIELGYKTKVGRRLRLFHGTGLVVHAGSVIGDDCTLRHGVTIGNRLAGGPLPTIGNNVEIGCGAIILGGITIGDGARIGAGAIVVKDVPSGAVALSAAATITPRAS